MGNRRLEVGGGKAEVAIDIGVRIRALDAMLARDQKGGPRVLPVLRYPGGKQRMLTFLSRFLPKGDEIRGRYVEPFVGGGAVFLYVQPRRAVISDLNSELIDLYRGIRIDPLGVWKRYVLWGSTKEEYNRVRTLDPSQLGVTERAARLLYLNRTCFKGNWRHNANGEFNIGYGGQSRRWVVTKDYLVGVSGALACAEIRCGDFEPVIDGCGQGDYLFVDPPYRPGQRELVNAHYLWKRFTFADDERLAAALRRCLKRGVTWCLTTSAHADILRLFQGFRVLEVPPRREGLSSSGEVLILGDGGGE